MQTSSRKSAGVADTKICCARDNCSNVFQVRKLESSFAKLESYRMDVDVDINEDAIYAFICHMKVAIFSSAFLNFGPQEQRYYPK